MNPPRATVIVSDAEWVMDYAFERGMADFDAGKPPDEKMEEGLNARRYSTGRLLAAFAKSRGIDISTVRKRTKAFRLAKSQDVFPVEQKAGPSRAEAVLRAIAIEYDGPLKNSTGLSILYDQSCNMLGGILRDEAKCIAIGIAATRLREIRKRPPNDGPVAKAIEALRHAEALTCAACGAVVAGLDAAGGLVVTHAEGAGRLFATVACRECAPRWGRGNLEGFRTMDACSEFAVAASRAG